jgi:AraC-like DNA-binding protein
VTVDRHIELPGYGRTRFTGFAADYATMHRRAELPVGTVTVLVNLGEPLVIDGADGPRAHGSFLTGLLSRATYTERTGLHSGIHVRLAPLAARAAFGVPMAELANGLVPLDAVLGKEYERLRNRLADTPDWPGRLAVLRDVLGNRLLRADAPPPVVAGAWRRLCETKGRTRIDEIVRASGVSHRHLVARFREEIGVTPKAAARILRFEHSLGRIRAGVPIATVAGEGGYYDQAHLDREFRALADTTPKRLRSDFSNTAGAPTP